MKKLLFTATLALGLVLSALADGPAWLTDLPKAQAKAKAEGKLVLVNRKARKGRNPATGETIQIKAKRVVKFRVAKAAKDAILGTK